MKIQVNELTESDFTALVTTSEGCHLTESELANQILNSAASIRHSESDDRVSSNLKESRDERSTLSARSS